MANPSHKDETYMEISHNALNVYEGQRAINELIARLHEAMRNSTMREELSATMQSLLYDPSMTEEEEAERPPRGNPNPPPSCHAKEDKRLNKMHEDIPHQGILESAPYPTLSQEKEGSESPIAFDSDDTPRR